ncbi:MAG: hypothetical protein FJX76_17705 [Armatimonadetes bacterium]|nr:hypothetical protein [Armatimonadota bacterium]
MVVSRTAFGSAMPGARGCTMNPGIFSEAPPGEFCSFSTAFMLKFVGAPRPSTLDAAGVKS